MSLIRVYKKGCLLLLFSYWGIYEGVSSPTCLLLGFIGRGAFSYFSLIGYIGRGVFSLSLSLAFAGRDQLWQLQLHVNAISTKFYIYHTSGNCEDFYELYGYLINAMEPESIDSDLRCLADSRQNKRLEISSLKL